MKTCETCWMLDDDVEVGEHDALGIAGAAAGENDGGQLIDRSRLPLLGSDLADGARLLGRRAEGSPQQMRRA